MNHFLFLFLGIMALLVSTGSCKQDVLDEPQTSWEEPLVPQENRTATVTGADIPEVMDFISEQTGGTMRYTLKGMPGTREPDLVLGEIDTATILENTNPYDLSNYTFKMQKGAPDGEVSFLNLVVKQTSTGMYSYIMKIRPDVNWLGTQSGSVMNMADYTGDIILYNAQGFYVHKTTFSGGQPQSAETRHPCEENNTTSTGGGGGGTTTTGNTPPGGGTTTTGGGCTVTVYLYVCCNDNYNPHPPIVCGCTPPTGTFYVIEAQCNILDELGNQTNPLRHPCPNTLPEECFEPNGDPCPFGCDANGNCAPDPNDPANENGETSIISTLDIPCQKLNNLLQTNVPFKDAIVNLQDKVDNNQQWETGYEVSKNPGNEVVTVSDPISGGDTVPLGHGGNIIGGMHLHTPGDGQPMFSGNDIGKLYLYTVDSNNSVSDNFTVVATDMGTFALTIKNRYLLSYIFQNVGVDELHQKLNREYDAIINPSPNEYLEAILDVFDEIKNHNNMPSVPIELYELNMQGTEFKKVTLNSQGEPEKSSCN